MVDKTVTYFKRYVSENEVEKILSCPIVRNSPKWNSLFNIMAYMGLRCNEVCKIQFKDILGDCDILRVTLSKTKGRIKDRVIPERIKPVLRLYLAMMKGKGHTYLFPPENNRSSHIHMQTASVRWKLWHIKKQLGISDIFYHSGDKRKWDRITSHAFRHFFITKIYRKTNYDIAATKEIIGHKRLDTTLVYIHNDIEREKKIMDEI